MNKICKGCGLTLNTIKDTPGYTPDLKNDFCMRCFRLKNYGEKKEETIISNGELVKKINKKKGIVFFLIDFLNINNETILLFKKIKLPKALIISKCDTLRKEMKRPKIKEWLRKTYNITEDIYFSSSKRNYLDFNIFEYLRKREEKVGIITGITNAGKSSFINNLLKNNNLKREILVSSKTNTTLDFIKLKFADLTIYDTPGFSYTNLNNKIIMKEVKPISLNLKEGNIIINDYIFHFNKPNQVILYLNTPEYKKDYQNYDLPYSLKIQANSDLILPGIGFLNIKNETEITTNLPNGELRKDVSEY